MKAFKWFRDSFNHLIEPVQRLYRRLSHWQKHLLINLALGILIESALIYFHDSSWVESMQDLAFDFLVRVDFGTRDLDEPAHGLLWVDIDQHSHLAWEEPIHIPRDKLRELIEVVVGDNRSGREPALPGLRPVAVLVDINLDLAGRSASNDERLVEYLKGYGGNCAGHPCPVILLPKTVRDLPGRDRPLWRPSRIPGLDDAVAGNPAIQWVSAYQELSSDFVIRRWKLWRCGDTEDGTSFVLPSFQLASLIAAHTEQGMVRQKLDEALFWAKGACLRQKAQEVTGKEEHVLAIEPFTIGNIQLRGDNSVVGRRIFYSVAQTESKGVFSPYLTDMQGEREPALIRYPAEQLLQHKTAAPGAMLQDRIVLIGGSHDDSSDFHMTPIGMMPGALVVANTIMSIVQEGEAREVSLLVKYGTVCVLIVLMSLFFLWKSTFWAMMASGAAVIFLLLPLSFIYFRQGMWLDFALPLLAVQLHEIVAEVEETMGRLGKSSRKEKLSSTDDSTGH